MEGVDKVAQTGVRAYNRIAEVWITQGETFQVAIVHLQGRAREACSFTEEEGARRRYP